MLHAVEGGLVVTDQAARPLVPAPEKLLIDTEIKLPNAWPLDPERQAQTDQALRRSDGGCAPLFVSWVRPDGGRFSATVVGGFQKAEAYAIAVRKFEKPLICRIGRFAYEGLPVKIQGYVPAAPVQATPDEERALILPGGASLPIAEGTSPEAPTRAEGYSAIERN